ncbi:hypothetical protein FDP41_013298 [Naegleria fowleri]|uniref:Aquaporin n=1 Tax=Naegleria fowleri TaxID=5763 RepID=A0A6A5C5R5_NAEFO|nr:uncharacterized protein FDP41_013298 [Naegleria fowleri]KAF0980815.1 hypothetical protein FDP41_013298 [Naegleria fowleri]
MSINNSTGSVLRNHPDIVVNWRGLLGELCGTSLYTFMGCTAASFSTGDVFQTSLCQAFTQVACFHIFAPISGAHFNPIITLATLITRNIGILTGILYIVMQIIGGVIGAAFCLLVTKSIQPAILQPPQDLGDAFRAFALEIILGFFIVMTMFGSFIKSQHLSQETGLEPISSVVATVPVALAIGGGALVNGSMNPVRTLGSQIIGWTWYPNCWIYFTAPFIGGALGGLFYEFIVTKPRRNYISLK